MDLTAIITQLIGGAIGGLGGGKLIKDSDLGPIVNLIVGAIGGLGGGALTGQMMGAAPAAGSMDIGALVTQLVGGGVGGAILQIVIGLIKNKMLAR